MNKISAVIIARNEEDKIAKCLESVKWMDEIIFIDQSSSDKTVEIAKKYTEKIFITSPKEICNPDREFGISKASNNWIFLLEADEIISTNLKDEILSIINSSNSADIYLVPVLTFFIGKPIKTCGWYPAYIPRLFKKGAIKFQSEIHTNGIFLSKNIKHLRNDLLHYSYNSINDWIMKMKRYTQVTAEEYIKNQKKPSLSNDIKELLIKPLYFFVLKYFFLKGYKDGWRGFFISISSALTILISYIKFLELVEKKIERKI